jgi:hypothetical protein
LIGDLQLGLHDINWCAGDSVNWSAEFTNSPDKEKGHHLYADDGPRFPDSIVLALHHPSAPFDHQAERADNDDGNDREESADRHHIGGYLSTEPASGQIDNVEEIISMTTSGG